MSWDGCFGQTLMQKAVGIGSVGTWKFYADLTNIFKIQKIQTILKKNNQKEKKNEIKKKWVTSTD